MSTEDSAWMFDGREGLGRPGTEQGYRMRGSTPYAGAAADRNQTLIVTPIPPVTHIGRDS
jgi:hypothetical protein